MLIPSGILGEGIMPTYIICWHLPKSSKVLRYLVFKAIQGKVVLSIINIMPTNGGI
jgi:hypothetical protein